MSNLNRKPAMQNPPPLLLEEGHFFQLIVVLSQSPLAFSVQVFHFVLQRVMILHCGLAGTWCPLCLGALSSLGYRCMGAAGTEAWDVGWCPPSSISSFSWSSDL